MKGSQCRGSGHRHSNQVFGLFRCNRRFLGMDPGVLVADIGHFKEIFVEAARLEGLHKHGFVGFGAAGGHHHPVKLMLDDFFFDLVLGILAAGKKVFIRIDHMGKGCSIIFNRRNIHDPSDVDTAVAHKNPDARRLADHIHLFGNFNLRNVPPPGFGKLGPCQTGGRTGFRHRSGNVLGSLEYSADINSGPRCGHRCKRMVIGKIVFVQFNAETLGKLCRIRLNLKAHRKYDHAIDLLFHHAGFIGILNDQITGFRNLDDAVHPGFDKTNPVFIPGPEIIFLVILAECPHIHIKDRTIQFSMGMLLGDHGLFDGVHAAYRRTIPVAAPVGIPGTDTLEPGNALGLFTVQRSHQMAEIGTGSA